MTPQEKLNKLIQERHELALASFDSNDPKSYYKRIKKLRKQIIELKQSLESNTTPTLA